MEIILTPYSTVSIHPTRVFGALFQSDYRGFSRLHLCQVSERGGGLQVTALHESKGIGQMHQIKCMILYFGVKQVNV